MQIQTAAILSSRPMTPADILTLGAIVAFAVVMGMVLNEWAKTILDRYTQDKNWKLLSARVCWLGRGPFMWTSSKNQYVYRIEVQDRNGAVYSGYARVGSYWFGLLDPKVEIQWIDGGLGPALF